MPVAINNDDRQHRRSTDKKWAAIGKSVIIMLTAIAGYFTNEFVNDVKTLKLDMQTAKLQIAIMQSTQQQTVEQLREIKEVLKQATEKKRGR